MSFTNNYVFIASVEALWLEDQFYKVLAIVPMHPAARVHWNMLRVIEYSLDRMRLS